LEYTEIKRKKTRSLLLGSVQVGGNAPVRVQSMTSTNTRDADSTIAQIKALEVAGCEIVRVAVPDREAAMMLGRIRKAITIPLIADIHFDHRLALKAIEEGVDGIRINPGNMNPHKIRDIVTAAKSSGTVIRIGVNSGSLEKEILDFHGGPKPAALVESALRSIHFFEELGFDRLKVSIKSSHVPTMIAAYRSLAEETDYPLHVGVTEAGTLVNAAVKSAIGIGTLLSEGIGDTIRVSVTGNPVAEIPVAYGILRALDIRRRSPDIISCPTCGRCEIDLAAIVEEFERRLAGTKGDLKIAIMGCVVNGPGEAKEADIGIAGGRGEGLLFKKGKIIRKLNEDELVNVLLEETAKLIAEKEENN
jgi:(E)-4-hydroxy-3-methylbut-2-enyl-diphosphate synthase